MTVDDSAAINIRSTITVFIITTHDAADFASPSDFGIIKNKVLYLR